MLTNFNGRPNDAEAEYEELRRRQGETPAVLLGLARCRRQQGQLPEALRQAYLAGKLQLLPTPKVVTVDTAPRRDHDVPTRYLDGNEWHDLVEVAGPDRVSGGQWNAGYAREYFRCVREDGMMVWLFRGAKQQTSDWFLHGWWD